MRIAEPNDPLLQSLSTFARHLKRDEQLLVLLLLAAATAASVLPPYFGYRYRGNFWAALFGTSDAMTSVTIDIFIVAASFIVWAWHDMHRLQLSVLTFVALICAFGVALALPIPLYLVARTVRQANLAAQQRTLQATDSLGAEPLLDPPRSVLCPLAVFTTLTVIAQAVFMTNVDNLRRSAR